MWKYCFRFFFLYPSQPKYFFHRRMGHGFRFLLPFSLLPPFFSKFSYKSFLFKIFIITRFSSFDNISRRHTSWIIRVFCVHSFSTDTEYTYYSWCMTSTDIVNWRKTNDYENFEKRGEEETKFMPHAPALSNVK